MYFSAKLSASKLPLHQHSDLIEMSEKTFLTQCLNLSEKSLDVNAGLLQADCAAVCICIGRYLILKDMDQVQGQKHLIGTLNTDKD